MRRILVLAGLAVLLLGTGCGRTEAVKHCRADLRQFTEETASYEAEYTTLYGPTAVSQSSIDELMSQEQRLICMSTDKDKREEYKAELYRVGFIESSRYLKFMIDTQQMPDFAAWEKRQQSAELASYRTGENQKVPIPSP